MLKVASGHVPQARAPDEQGRPLRAPRLIQLKLDRGQVAAWWIEVGDPSPERLARWRDVLSEGERARADRFRRATDATTYVAAHALTRALLSDVALVAPRQWEFVVGPRGKPAVAPERFPDLCFNLAHTPGFAAAAVTRGSAIGIDVERSDRSVAGTAIARRFFAPGELAALDNLPPVDRPAAFYRLWTLKEAYLKAIGEGLHRPLDSFAFTLDPVRVHFTGAFPDDPAAWQFFELAPTPFHVLALAVRRPGTDPVEVQGREVDPSELL